MTVGFETMGNRMESEFERFPPGARASCEVCTDATQCAENSIPPTPVNKEPIPDTPEEAELIRMQIEEIENDRRLHNERMQIRAAQVDEFCRSAHIEPRDLGKVDLKTMTQVNE